MSGEPQNTEVQRRIDELFAAESSYWDEVYTGSGGASSLYRHRRRSALAWVDDLALPEESRLLEVGCGAGLLAIELARRGFSVAAVDRVSEMVERTRRHAREAGVQDRVSVGRADATRLPFEDGAFALVVALGLLPWVTKLDDTLEELARVVAPGGFLLVSADNRYAVERWLDPLRTPLLGALKPVAVSFLERRGRVRRDAAGPYQPPLSRAGLRRRLRRAGLEPTRLEAFGVAPLTFCRRPVRDGRLQARLDHLVDTHRQVARAVGSQHLALARKPGRLGGTA